MIGTISEVLLQGFLSTYHYYNQTDEETMKDAFEYEGITIVTEDGEHVVIGCEHVYDSGYLALGRSIEGKPFEQMDNVYMVSKWLEGQVIHSINTTVFNVSEMTDIVAELFNVIPKEVSVYYSPEIIQINKYEFILSDGEMKNVFYVYSLLQYTRIDSVYGEVEQDAHYMGILTEDQVESHDILHLVNRKYNQNRFNILEPMTDTVVYIGDHSDIIRDILSGDVPLNGLLKPEDQDDVLNAIETLNRFVVEACNKGHFDIED